MDPPDKSIPMYYGDRFIPRRYLLTNCERNLKFIIKKPSRDALKLVIFNVFNEILVSV